MSHRHAHLQSETALRTTIVFFFSLNISVRVSCCDVIAKTESDPYLYIIETGSQKYRRVLDRRAVGSRSTIRMGVL
jgi:hypothetical protein